MLLEISTLTWCPKRLSLALYQVLVSVLALALRSPEARENSRVFGGPPVHRMSCHMEWI